MLLLINNSTHTTVRPEDPPEFIEGCPNISLEIEGVSKGCVYFFLIFNVLTRERIIYMIFNATLRYNFPRFAQKITQGERLVLYNCLWHGSIHFFSQARKNTHLERIK